jgi:hypothetical protein
MVIFHSYVGLPEGNFWNLESQQFPEHPHFGAEFLDPFPLCIPLPHRCNQQIPPTSRKWAQNQMSLSEMKGTIQLN